MTMTDNKIPTDTEMDALFAEAAHAAPTPSAELLKRIVADADTVGAARQSSTTRPRRGLFETLVASLGGWPAVAGLATAAVVGIWIGYVAPDTLNELTGPSQTTGTYELGDLIPAFDFAGQEG
jgi:hypothetical protein